MSAPLSAHLAQRRPSAIRVAGIRFAARADEVDAINVAIGNVSLPMHPAMIERLRRLGEASSPFAEGVVRYTPTVGIEPTRAAFHRVMQASGLDTEGLHVQVTDGGSQGMELVIVACCGPAGSDARPLMLIDAAYTNYLAFAARLGRRTVSIQRHLQEDGRFTLPPIEEIDSMMAREKPGALVVIPYDNPTGQLYEHETLVALARLCVEHGVWMVSDEAYRELQYVDRATVSIWNVGEDEAPGITGQRISLETASKVFNACGLRMGALVTDNRELHERCVAENTASLCPNHIGQWIYAALGEVPAGELRAWFTRQRSYYRPMMQSLTAELGERLPGVIVSRPDASLYSVIDVRAIAPPDFDAMDFVLWCAEKGRVDIDGRAFTLLTAPMAEFYDLPDGADNPGRTQMRVAYVEPPERMARVPQVFAELFERYRNEA